MADSTGCLLQIGGLISRQGAAMLSQALAKQRPYNLEGLLTPDQIFQALMEGRSEWDFDEVRDGKMQDNLRQALSLLMIDHAWAWNWGQEYAPGIILRDEIRDCQDQFLELENAICLPVHELDQKDRIAAAKIWTAFRQGLTLTPYQSDHELASLLRSRPDLMSRAKQVAGIDYTQAP